MQVQVQVGTLVGVGVARANSPDAPCATNPLRGSVPACPPVARCQLRFGILPSLAANAARLARAAPLAQTKPL